MYGEKVQLQHLSDVLREVQMYARDRLENKWLPEFLESSEFKKRHLAKMQISNKRTSIKVRNKGLQSVYNIIIVKELSGKGRACIPEGPTKNMMFRLPEQSMP